MKGNLITEQHKYPDISCLFKRAVDENEVSTNPVCYFVKNGLLMRKCRPPHVSAEDEWAIEYQVFIPQARPGGIVGYQYTLYFHYKIPIYLKIVKYVIFNT